MSYSRLQPFQNRNLHCDRDVRLAMNRGQKRNDGDLVADHNVGAAALEIFDLVHTKPYHSWRGMASVISPGGRGTQRRGAPVGRALLPPSGSAVGGEAPVLEVGREGQREGALRRDGAGQIVGESSMGERRAVLRGEGGGLLQRRRGGLVEAERLRRRRRA